VHLQARTIKAAVYLYRFLVFVANGIIELKDILTLSLFFARYTKLQGNCIVMQSSSAYTLIRVT